jgi:hypothetical protein
MITRNENKIPEVETINFDALCQDFDGQSFYGLEYILEDFFHDKTPKNAAASYSSLDWFGQ